MLYYIPAFNSHILTQFYLTISVYFCNFCVYPFPSNLIFISVYISIFTSVYISIFHLFTFLVSICLHFYFYICLHFYFYICLHFYFYICLHFYFYIRFNFYFTFLVLLTFSDCSFMTLMSSSKPFTTALTTAFLVVHFNMPI